jgi:glycosyltransferase involved in cell wall biosynthesis
VADGETGLLAAERDLETLTKNILLLFDDSAMWQRFSRAARNRVEWHFDLSKQTADLENIYEEAMAQHAERAVATR